MIESILKKYVSESSLVKLNDNEKIVNGILNMLRVNIDKHGNAYCPCQPNKSEDTICPCKNHLEMINSTGHCHCNLLLKK